MAEELYIEAKLDAKKLYADLNKLKRDIEAQKVDVKIGVSMWDVQAKVDNTKKSVDWLKVSTEWLADAQKNEADQSKQLADALQKANEITKKMWEDSKLTSRDIAEMQEVLKILRQSLKNLSWEEAVEVRTAIVNMGQAMNASRRELRELNAEVEESSGKLWLFGKIQKSVQTWLLTTFGVFSIAWMVGKWIKTVVSNIKESIDVSIAFESAFAWVRKTVEATEYQFVKFNEELKELSTIIPSTYEDLAQIAELWWQMGIPIGNLVKFTKTLAAIDVSTDLGLEQWALQISRIANVMWIAYNDVDRLWSAIVDLWNNFAATESEISNFMQRISWAGRVVWLSAWDVAGIGAAFTSVGIAAEKWGTSVNKMLMAIEDAVNTWWSKLQTFAKLSNTTAEEFSKSRRDNAWEAFVNVVEWLNRVWPNATKYLNELVWWGVRLQETFLNMAKAWDSLREAIEMWNSAYIENIALWEEAAKRYGTVESQLQMITNEIRIQQDILGKEFQPILLWLKNAVLYIYTAITELIVSFKELGKGVQTLISAWWIAALIALFFSLWPLIGWIWTAIVWLWAWLAALGKHFRDVSPALAEIEKWLKEVNKELLENDRAIDELREKYIRWQMSLEEYRNELEKLLETKDKLNQKQKEYAAALAAEAEISSQISWYNETLHEQEKVIEKTRDFIIVLNEKMKDLDDSYNNGKITLEKYNKEKEKLNSKIEEENIKLNKANERYDDYLVAVQNMIPWLATLNKYTDDSVGLLEILNGIKLDTSGNVDELDKEREAIEKSAAATRRFLEAKLKQFEVYQKILTVALAAPLWLRSLFSNLFGDADRDSVLWVALPFQKTINGIKSSLASLDNFTFDGLVSWIRDANNIIVAQSNDIVVSELKTIESLKDWYNIVTRWLDKTIIWSKEHNELLKKQKEIQQAINEAVREYDEWPDVSAKWWSKEDPKKRLIALLEIEAMRRIQIARDMLDNEESVAKETLNIYERLNEEKKKLDEDFISIAVDWAKKLIQEYEELRKRGTGAFKDLAKDVESASSDIEKLIKKIKELNEKLEALDVKKTDDLGKRYVVVQKTIDELNYKIKELNVYIEQQWEDWKTVIEMWDELQESIKNTTREAEDYTKEIDKIKQKMDDLNKSETDKLSERYAKVVEEVEKLNAELEVYTRYDILTDVDAKKKIELEKQLNSLLWEQQLIRQSLTDEQLVRAEWMVWETEAERIIRESKEKRLAYQDEINDYEAKLVEQQSLLESYREQEYELSQTYDTLIVSSDEKKYKDMLKNLQKYTEERDKLIQEQTHLKTLLTAKEIQEAINQSKKTETTLILEKYNLEKATLNQELADYKSQLNEKLKALATFYGNAAKLQAEFGRLGISFSQEDMDKLMQSNKNLSWLSVDDRAYMSQQMDYQKSLLKEQEEARKLLDNMSKNIGKMTDAQLKWLWEDALRKLYAEIARLKLVAWVGWSNTTNNTSNSITNNQSFNLSSNLDAAAVARQIRLSIRI